MPTPTTQDAPALEDYAEFLSAVDAAGVGFAVIGGAAVGLYARLLGEAIISSDLDLVVSERELPTLLQVTSGLGAIVEKLPQPRAVPVALLRWRGLEVNALTASEGLPPAERVVGAAREMFLPGGRVSVPVADPLDLLQNKLAVARPKDMPHIALLRRFIDSEIVADFGDADLSPRGRLRTVRRYLEICQLATLPSDLFARLEAAAIDATARRFLAGHCATKAEAQLVLGSGADENERQHLTRLIAERFDP